MQYHPTVTLLHGRQAFPALSLASPSQGVTSLNSIPEVTSTIEIELRCQPFCWGSRRAKKREWKRAEVAAKASDSVVGRCEWSGGVIHVFRNARSNGLAGQNGEMTRLGGIMWMLGKWDPYLLWVWRWLGWGGGDVDFLVARLEPR